MNRLAALLVFALAVPVASATTPDVEPPEPISLVQARVLVNESEVAAAFRAYRPTGADEIRLLVLVDRDGKRADLALASDGSLWMVSRGTARPATSRDLAAAQISKSRLVEQLQARKIRPIALRIPRTWLVTRG